VTAIYLSWLEKPDRLNPFDTRRQRLLLAKNREYTH
jgi:hypothetical protein